MTTEKEREHIYSRAAQLVHLGQNAMTEQLQREFGISKQRARHAAAKAIRRSRRP